MNLHLTNLDELLQQIRNKHARNYICESIASYRAGSYRASLITTWIAVSVDVIEKIRELSGGDDPAAIKIVTELDGIKQDNPKGMLEFERKILDYACNELQFISNIEKNHLERLKEDRNICAHPTFSEDGEQFNPTPELALSYIVQASQYLLIHHPVKGRVVLDRLYALVNEPSFPEDSGQAYILLSSEHNLGRVKPSVVSNFITILFKRILKDEELLYEHVLNRIVAALNATSRLYPDLYSEVVTSKFNLMLSNANDSIFKRIFPLLCKMNYMWSSVGESEKVRIEGLIRSANADDIIKYQIVQLSGYNAAISKILRFRLSEMSEKDKMRVFSAYPSAVFKDDMIDMFVSSGSFMSAIKKSKELILPIASKFDSNDMEKLFSGVLSNGAHGFNQVLDAGGIDKFFAELFECTKDTSVDHEVIWCSFWGKLIELGYNYANLQSKMIEDKYIVPENEDLEDEIPF